MRRAARRDEAEEPIVNALEAIGCLVYKDLPGDLLIHRPSWGKGWFRVQEVKTGKAKTQRKQKRQKDFLEDTGCAVVRSIEDSFKDINV